MADKVLIVDDTMLNRRILQELLRREGIDAACAENGAQALEKAVQYGPDLILLDVMMPELDGFEVCRRLKSDCDTASVPIIFLSALGEVDDKVRGLSLGAEDYITKPFENAEVMARVRAQLRLRGLARELKERNKELLQKQARLEEDLRAAADIQRALIPRRRDAIPAVRLEWLFEPCSEVGGDIFCAERLDETHAALYLLDVNGHGVPPAMMSMMVAQCLAAGSDVVARRAEGRPVVVTRPAEVLAALDREFPLGRFDRYFTICYLVLDFATGHLRFSSAGHPSPVLVRADGSVRSLDEGGTIVGLGDGIYEEGELELRKGDRLYLYSDGITEHEHRERGLFGPERLVEALVGAVSVPLAEACATVRRSLDAFGDCRLPADDLTLLAVEYQGPCA
ncbi:MAG: SpoIIE family protein phosphatase [Vicinamibacteria bacterium]